MFHLPTLRKYIGLSLASGTILALQVIFTRIFSIMIWYHFAYLVVGVALLGGGAAGTYLAVRRFDKVKLQQQLGKFTTGFSLSIVVDLLVTTVVRFDTLGGREAILPAIIGLAIYFIALFVTFFLGGVTVASVFSLWSDESHRLYFADLLGASVGTLLVVVVIQNLGGPGALVLCAFLAVASALLLGNDIPQLWRQTALLVSVGQVALLFMVSFVSPHQLPVPQSKDLGWALSFVNADQPEYTRWNPVGRVDVLPPIEVVEPMIVGGVSSVYFDPAFQAEVGYEPESHLLRLVTLDGTSMTGMYRFDGDLSPFRFLHHAVISAPYQVSVENPTTLHIGVGGGLDIILARLYNAESITAIDINSDVIELLTGPYAEFSGQLAADPRTTITVAEGRGFLMKDDAEYDLIQGIGLDNLSALSSGAYVLSESYLYTVDAFELALEHLSPQGVFAWTRNVNDPPRETLRLVALLAEALRRLGIADPVQHIAIVANEQNVQATILASRVPFEEAAIQRLRNWAAQNRFNMLYDPLERLDTVYTDYLFAADPRAFEASYPYNIFPVTDDNPFFYNYFRWTDFGINSDSSNTRIVQRFPIGNLILLLMLGFSVFTAVVFIVLPLVRHKRSGLQTPNVLPTLAYFSLLGLGYIFVEIVFIQRFTLFIGYPTHAITTTIFSMLFFSAVGSLVAKRLVTTPHFLRLVVAAIAILILLYAAGLPALLQTLLPLPDTLRIVVSTLIIAPLAFLMGMPFPTGLRKIGAKSVDLVSWAWGLNGVFSVLGSVVVIVISITTNFTTSLTVAALFYAAAAVLAIFLWKIEKMRLAVLMAA